MNLNQTGGMEVYTSLDGIGYEHKPTNEIPQIKRRTSGRWTKVGVRELAKMVGECGHAIVPGHMQGGMKADNCTAMQLFVLDFDEGATFGEILDRCGRLGLPITFAYHTFSSTEEKEKFRVVFAYGSVLEDIFAIKLILAMLHRIFPECDQSCKNPDRVFLGGKELIYIDENARIALVQLIIPFYQSLDVGENFRRNIFNFCKKQGVLLVDGMPAIMGAEELETWGKTDGFTDSTIIHKIEESTEPSIFILESKNGLGLHQNNTCKEKTRKLGITGDVTCRLLDDFNNGIHLSHDARFALCTNLMYISGGRKHFLEILGKYYESGADGKLPITQFPNTPLFFAERVCEWRGGSGFSGFGKNWVGVIPDPEISGSGYFLLSPGQKSEADTYQSDCKIKTKLCGNNKPTRT